MPIQLTIKQPTGVAATYHVVSAANAVFTIGTCNVQVDSYLDQQSHDARMLPLSSVAIDVSPILTLPATAVPLVSQIELYLISTTTPFTGGLQVGL